MLFKTQTELPARITAVIDSVEGAGTFIGAIKTSLKPNATIPLLWIVLTENYFLLCNTHRTRGLTAKIPWQEINCVRRKGNLATVVELLFNSMDVDDQVIALPDDTVDDDVAALLDFCAERITRRSGTA